MGKPRLPKLLAKHPGAALVLACYAVALLLHLAVCTVALAQNRAAYASGELTPATLTLSDFELNDEIYQREDGMLVTSGADPQLLLVDRERRVESLTLHLGYSRAPRIRQVFWAVPGQDYDLRKTAYPFGRAEGEVVTFLLPPGGGQSLRIDPDSEAGTVIEFVSVTINERRPFWQFYQPDAGQALGLLLVPLLVGCGVSLVLEAALGRVFLRRKPNNPDGAPPPGGEGAAGDG
ncbi:hypothetical protein LJC60_03600 [Ruminococcaceae bacterium OttesenSCG-928-D13]|nr:hypothetical protein [Ruminococcaceae bacterium OttesenSCG-928-D13]